MRIAMIAHTDAPWTPRYSRWLLAHGHEVRVFSFCPDQIDGVDTVFVGRLPYAPLKDKKPFILHVGKVRKLLKAYGPDVVFAPYLISNGLCASLAWSGKLVVSARGSDVLRPKGTMQLASGVRGVLVRWITHRAKHVHAVSQPLREALIAEGVPSEKISVFPIGVDTAKFPLADVPDAPTPHFVCTRRHAPVYRNHIIVEALAALRDRGHGFTMTFVGGGYLLEERRSQISALGLDDCVTCTGFVPHEEIRANVARADVYISASRSDGTSSSLMEALATGPLPVISDIVANRPWIEAGETGLFFPVDDVVALTDALERAVSDEALRMAARERNRTTALERADEGKNMTALERMLSEAAR